MKIAMKSKLILGLASALVAVVVMGQTSTAQAQQGAAERAGEALDNAGRNIRFGVESAFLAQPGRGP